jgi:uncharacterized membrane protein
MRSLLLVVLIAIGLRFVALDFDGLWLDEGYQTIVESYGIPLIDLTNLDGKPILIKPKKPGSPAEVLANFRKVDPLCPPLFALLMNRWINTFGGSDFAIRSLAATLSILSVLAIYLVGCNLFHRHVALCAALLQAISPFDISYAQEARMYTMLVLLSTLSGGVAAILYLRPQRAKTVLFAGIYIVATWALVNTHYTGLFIWCFEIVAGIMIAFLRRDWLLFAWCLVANILIATLCLPWFALFQQAAAIRTESFYIKRTASFIWPFWAVFVRIPLNWISFLTGKRVMLFSAPIYLSALVILSAGLKKLWRSHTQSYLPLFLTAWCLLPALAVCLLDIAELHRVIEIPRYLIGTAPAVYLIAGLGLSQLLQSGKPGYFLLIFHSIFAIANTVYSHIVHQREDWPAAANVLSKRCAANEVVFVSQYYDIICLDRYLSEPMRQIGVSPQIGQDQMNKLIAERIGTPKRFWVMTAQEGDAVFRLIPKQYTISERYDFPHALHLRHYKKQPI